MLVIGAGPAGLAAALAAGRNGARVILADDQPEPGGQLLSERFEIGGRPAMSWVSATMQELCSLPEVRVLERTTVTGYYDHNFLVGCQRLGDVPGPQARAAQPRERLWKIRAREVVIATGSIERPIVFPDNDRPGIMLSQSVRAYVNRYGVKPGSRVAIVTTNDDAYRTALDLAAAGVTVSAVVDMRGEAQGFLPQRARARGIEVLPGYAVVGTEGRKRVDSIRVQALGGERPAREIECDLVAVSGGWVPTVHLYSQSRGRLEYDAASGAFLPGAALQPVRCAGAARGGFLLRDALTQGAAAGAAAAQRAGLATGATTDVPQTTEPEESAAEPHHAYQARSSRRKQFVDFQSDVTAADVALAAREGYDGVEHLKRYTTTGMGVDQGKTSNLNALAALADLRGCSIADIGTTTFRPPYMPLGLGAIAGADAGALFEPARKTPLHAWHERNGAVFEDVGQWKRAWHYPRAGESMRAAVDREALAARKSVGILDASTLGKIDVQGPDAAEFLDRIYCNNVRTLGVGRCRYGLMLRLDGMVFDDGVIARLAENHFLLSTTTGGAARVLAWLEEWLQTEWPKLRVYCTSVTEHYAQVALSGPASIALLTPLTAIKLDSMPFMSVREGQVAGIPARMFRVSFTGALGYEVQVPAGRAYELWTTLMGAGERFSITPYGTEAMHVLRAEKGFIIVGQETDGSVTPVDLGLERMLARGKQFIGKRSLARPDLDRPGRRQLVGLLTEIPDVVLPEGVQLVAEPRFELPAKMEGYVTSSYFSANCGRSIALALVKDGIARMGETLYVPLDGDTVKVTVTPPQFLSESGGVANG